MSTGNGDNNFTIIQLSELRKRSKYADTDIYEGCISVERRGQ
ncbi:MAG: hypothetical protein WCA39_09875 [Nitrososphaeraceae archaeon]